MHKIQKRDTKFITDFIPNFKLKFGDLFCISIVDLVNSYNLGIKSWNKLVETYNSVDREINSRETLEIKRQLYFELNMIGETINNIENKLFVKITDYEEEQKQKET